MTMPDMPNTEPSTTQVILVALNDLRDPDWNPRDFFDEEEMQSLMDFIQAGGRTEPIVIWTPSPENAEDEPIGPPWAIISGKRRREAYRRLGRTHIEAIPLDIPLEEAMFMAIAANRDSKPFWLGEYKRVETLVKRYGKLTQVEIKARTGWSKSRVSRAVNLTQLLNPASRVLITQPRPKKVSPGNFSDDENDQDSTKPGIWRLPEKVATRLIPLWDEKNPEASQARAEQAVRKIIDQQLTGSKTDELVSYTLAGGDLAQFEATATVRKARASKAARSQNSSPAPTHTHPTPIPSTKPLEDSSASPAGTSSHGSQQPGPSTDKEKPEKPSWFWQWMVGIKFFSQLKSKVKKGETLSNTEKWIVVLYRVYKFVEPPFKHSGKFIGRLLKKAGKGLWDSIEKALGKTAKSILDFVLPLIFIGLLIWGILAFFHFVVVSPLHWIENKIGSVFHHEEVTPPTPQPSASTILPKTEVVVTRLAPEKKIQKTAPTVIYQPAVSFAPPASSSDSAPVLTLYDPKLLEQEIAAVPKNAFIKAFAVYPDEGMPGDLAVSRIQGVTDPDKYTMKIGSGTQKIISINTTTTNLIINYKSTDPFGILDSSGPLNFFWEDVLYIHTDEIDVEDKTPYKIYQCSLVVSGSKYALTIQCASADDLKHLVSALEYFIRNSRLGHDTALAGMPYPSQGLRFAGSENIINLLWADSLADKAGVKLGDRLWSVGKVSNEQQGKEIFEKSLQMMPVTLFVVSPADWDNALVAKNTGMSHFFSPKMRKMVLAVL
jgi:ParB-like chromosome segregation protein Spo0J